MSLHKLTAGTGYTYLTRQVAAQDRTGGARTPLASYYTERGETPGHWVGSGMAGIDGLNVGDEVTAQQMQSLFGSGLHPLAQQRRELLEGPDLSEADLKAVTRLGIPFKVFTSDVTAFQVEVAKRIEDHAASLGHPRDYPVQAADRARIRTQVATEFFRAEHDRDPADARELSGAIAKLTRPRTTAVAGYDLTFSPVKSVSTLWAIAPPDVAAQIELAHNEAVADALDVPREARPVHPRGHQRGTPGRRHRAGRDGVHPSRLTRRGPRPAHPHRGGQQGADPDREVALGRRSNPVQGQRHSLRDVQHQPWRSTCGPGSGWSSRNVPAPTAASGRSARSSVSTPA